MYVIIECKLLFISLIHRYICKDVTSSVLGTALTGVETNILKPGRIKPKLSACLDTTKGFVFLL